MEWSRAGESRAASEQTPASQHQASQGEQHGQNRTPLLNEADEKAKELLMRWMSERLTESHARIFVRLRKTEAEISQKIKKIKVRLKRCSTSIKEGEKEFRQFYSSLQKDHQTRQPKMVAKVQRLIETAKHGTRSAAHFE
uniref:Uncharacterized protein n=1 Tax=Lotharella oceanica TaxID=641309 RepID=A0A7S2TV31_9EUKA